jgi:hypothetical protein
LAAQITHPCPSLEGIAYPAGALPRADVAKLGNKIAKVMLNPMRLLLLFCSVVLVASFLPWATLSADGLADPASQFNPLQSQVAVGGGILFPKGPFTAWRGVFVFAGYSLPNWLVVVAAAAVLLLSRWPGVVIAIAILSLLHLLIFALAIAAMAGATLQVGYWMTLLAYGLLLGGVLFHRLRYDRAP